MMLTMTLPRFEASFDRRGPDDCWPWTGPVQSKGYGRFYAGEELGGYHLAHRFAYALVKRLRRDHTIDHLCRNHGCVNPAHLEAVSRGTNVLRGIGRSAVNARKTECSRGHRFTKENTRLVERRGTKERHCRECSRLATARYRARQKEL